MRHIQDRTRSVLRGVTTLERGNDHHRISLRILVYNDEGTIRVISGTPIMPMHPSLAATTDYCGRRLAGDAFSEATYQ